VDEPILRADVGHRLTRVELDARVEVGREIVGLVGPSGAGKSTFLRAIAGTFAPERGVIRLGERVLFDRDRRTNVPPERRRVGLVFQDGALFPHLTVAENVAFGVSKGQRRSRTGRLERATSMLDRFGLAALAGTKPDGLSGGERRRAALARALAAEPDALLLDEPFTGLDVSTKAHVSAEVARLVREANLPVILVAHEFEDVVGLVARVAVMESGRVVQTGTPAELLAGPETPFVAALTGVNYVPGSAFRRGDLTEVRAVEGTAVLLSTDAAAGPVAAIVAPWDVAISVEAPAGSALNSVTGPVVHLAGVGNRVRVAVAGPPTIVAEITDESARRLALSPGVRVVASWKATGTRLVRVGR
jgi:ABC-type sulfate/molybdate transport systems ATPase subunit